MLFSTLAAGLFYGLFCMTLRRDRWLQLNLWYLLVTLGFSLVFPFFSLPDRFTPVSWSATPAREYLITLDEIEISATPASQAIGLTDVYIFGLVVCVAYLLFQMVAQAVLVFRLRLRHTVYRSCDGFDIPRGSSLILLDDDTAPYSFFRQIVFGTRGLNGEEMRCILAHESHHVSQLHTIELLLAWLMCCLAWFNPFAWLMMRELRAVQEFQADATSVSACGREDYLHLLYRQVTGTGYGHITNNFQSINIKNRIVMMNKTKTRFGAWKVLAALPVAAVLLMVGCKQKAAEPIADEEVVTATAPSVEPEFIKDSLPDGLEPPTYPGGEAALYKYIAENVHYPEQAKSDGVEGKVYVRFSVTEDGSIVNAYVARGVGGECDEEALRVIKAMPKWIPATYEGKHVAVEYVVPINFKLQ